MAKESFTVLQEWEGYVIRVGYETFAARLIDLKTLKVEEDAEIYLNQVTFGDLQFLRVGAMFRWQIGYVENENRGMKAAGKIHFLPSPCLSREDISQAQKSAQGIRKTFGWNGCD